MLPGFAPDWPATRPRMGIVGCKWASLQRSSRGRMYAQAGQAAGKGLGAAVSAGPAAAVAATAAPPAGPPPAAAVFGAARTATSPLQARREVPLHWKEHIQQLRPGEQRALYRYAAVVDEINDLGAAMERMSDEGLRSMTDEFRQRLRRGEGLDALLAEAFAVVREAAWRVLRMRHYDVQLLGGLALHEGRVAEMKTGEGKTLVATLPAYLHALEGNGVHVVTVNDYLARRDAEWIGKVFSFLGLSVGVVTAGTTLKEQVAAYAADITYVTAYQLAFSILQDNSAAVPAHITLRRPLAFAIVDEVDSVLIDECRNPFIISLPGSTANFQDRWRTALQVAAGLRVWTHPSKGTTDAVSGATDTAQAPELLPPSDAGAVLDAVAKMARLTKWGMRQAAWELVESGHIVVARAGHSQVVGVIVDKAPPSAGSLPQQQQERHQQNGAAANAVASDVAGAAASTHQLLIKQQGGWVASRPAGSGQREEVDAALRGAGLERVEDPSGDQLDAVLTTVLWEGEEGWGRFLVTAVQAIHLYHEDIDYIVRNGRVVIVDEATGRERERSRWQHGLHCALEVKHGLALGDNNSTQASITYQCLLGYYAKLAGMTGTAVTEEEELEEVYGLKVLRVPPHRPSRRRDNLMECYIYGLGKLLRLGQLVQGALEAGRPVLACTPTVEESEALLGDLQYLQEIGILNRCPIQLLNARPEAVRREAKIIAQAGEPGAVTIATAMAGRGTDILLGGNPKLLTQMALESKLLPVLASGASDLSDERSDRPLRARGDPFRDDAAMRAALPGVVFHAFEEAREALAQHAEALQAHGAGLTGVTGARWLTSALERAEVDKAHILCEAEKLGAEQEGADRWGVFLTALNALWQAKAAAGEGAEQHAERALERYILLQWAWFDEQCAALGQEVVDAGGLLVIITSQPHSLRTELQMRGRAGRQGDPGDTFLLTSYDDPLFKASVFLKTRRLMAHSHGIADLDTEVEKDPMGARRFLAWPEWWRFFGERATTAGLASYLNSTLSTWESSLRDERKRLRQYDQVVDVCRRSAYTLRRTLLCGTPAQRGLLMRQYLAGFADVFVASMVDALRPPAEWDLEGLCLLLHSTLNYGQPVAQLQGQPFNVSFSEAFGWFMPLLNVRPEETAAQLRHALQDGRPLPAIWESWVPSSRPKPPSFREMVSEQLLEQVPAVEAEAAVGAPYSPEASRLREWLTDVLVYGYERRKELMADTYARMRGSAPLRTRSLVRLWEKELMLSRFDALWGDFHQDVTQLQASVALRAFSQLDPMDEFRLEAGELFAELLEDYRQHVVLAAFSPLDLLLLEHLTGERLAEPRALPSAESQPLPKNGSPGGAVILDLSPADFLMEEPFAREWIDRHREQLLDTQVALAQQAVPSGNGSSGGGDSSSVPAGREKAARTALNGAVAASEELQQPWSGDSTGNEVGRGREMGPRQQALAGEEPGAPEGTVMGDLMGWLGSELSAGLQAKLRHPSQETRQQ